ncbi:hypothetical protein ABTP01_14270 [Acinetobacter baumannii]
MKIIYQNDAGGVAVVHPTAEALASLTIDEIAQRCVPTGKPYKIVDESEVPTDRTFRDAWTVDEATLTDGVGE